MSRIVLLGVNPSLPEPLYSQIYTELRRRILDGRLPRGTRIPSSRALADDLDVARSTVVQAFEQLQAEGYLETTSRGATRVSRTVPDTQTTGRPPSGAAIAGRAPVRTARRVKSLAKLWPHFRVVPNVPARAFRTSVPALDVFPTDIWSRLIARRARRSGAASLAYPEAGGLTALRESVADYLTRARGVRCSAAQVFITSGSQQGLDLAARVLVDPGDRVWMEDPGYFGAGGAFVAAGARLVPVRVDRDGLDVADGVRRAPDARVAFVTPARQLPLGVTMTLPRRLALLQWAARHRSWIVEDDYDSEFRYATRPLASLQGLDRNSSVLFTGTFSKVMFPAMRLGYLVVPDRLVDAFATTRRYADFAPPYLTQAAMADFIADGHFERHIRRMREMYGRRRDLLVSLLKRSLGDLIRLDAPDSGLNLIVWLPAALDDRGVASALAEAGVDALPLSSFALARRMKPGLMLGYSGVREPDLRDGVTTLTRVLTASAAAARR